MKPLHKPLANVQLSGELLGRLDGLQRGFVKDRRVQPLIEMHTLGLNVSVALQEAFTRGYHDISKALLELKVEVTDHAEFIAANRGKDAFGLLRQYHRPGQGALRSAVTRRDQPMLEDLTEAGVKVLSGLYSFVPTLIKEPVDKHHDMLRVLVANTPSCDLTSAAMAVIARYAKPATLIAAMHRSPAPRSLLITHALNAGAAGNVIALRQEGVKVSALAVNRFVKNALPRMSARPMSETLANLLELYREDHPQTLPGSVTRKAVKMLLDHGATELIHCRYVDDVPRLNNVKRGLASLAACANPVARGVLDVHVTGWMVDRNRTMFPGLSAADQATLTRECEECFQVGDALTVAPQDEPFSTSPTP